MQHKYKHKKYSLLLLCTLFFSKIKAQDFYQEERSRWAKIAEETEPKLIENIKRPQRIVSIVKDNATFQGWKATDKSLTDSLFTKSFKKNSGVVLDFGEHLTGFVSFKIEDNGRATAWSCTPIYFIRKYPHVFQH